METKNAFIFQVFSIEVSIKTRNPKLAKRRAGVIFLDLNDDERDYNFVCVYIYLPS